jgi:hypothetical protein
MEAPGAAVVEDANCCSRGGSFDCRISGFFRCCGCTVFTGNDFAGTARRGLVTKLLGNSVCRGGSTKRAKMKPQTVDKIIRYTVGLTITGRLVAGVREAICVGLLLVGDGSVAEERLLMVTKSAVIVKC